MYLIYYLNGGSNRMITEKKMLIGQYLVDNIPEQLPWATKADLSSHILYGGSR